MHNGLYVSKLYINILVDWSLSGVMTSKLVIRESESPRPAASSILISRMASSSVIILYVRKTRRAAFGRQSEHSHWTHRVIIFIQ